MKTYAALLMTASLAAAAGAQTVVSTFDDITEGFKGDSWSHNGVTYSQVNNVHGQFPGGDTFEPGDGIFGLGNQVIVERATYLYNDFPNWGSANNALTFGAGYVPGDNLSLGALSTVTMTLDQVAEFASFEMAYYENGPWSGIQFHFDAYMGDTLVASDSFTIAGDDLEGRDNIAFNQMTVSGAQFDSLHLYATFGDTYSGPRILMDNLTITYVPAPGSVALLGMGGLLARRRRR